MHLKQDKQINEKTWEQVRPLIGQVKGVYGPPTNIFQMVYRQTSMVSQEIQNAFGSSLPIIFLRTPPSSDSGL